MLDVLVLVAGSVLAYLAFPSELFSSGWPLLGPFLLVPVFWFTARQRPWAAAGGGVLWISLVTLSSQSWLLSFHPFAFPLVWLFSAPWYALGFGLSSLLWRRLPRGGVWAQALWWTGLEFLRVQGFFAYPYNTLSSVVAPWPILYQSADLVGTSGVAFLLAWSSAWLAALATRQVPWRRLRLDLGLGLSLWAANLTYGVAKLSAPETGPLWRPALVQEAQDPWSERSSVYEAGLDRLESLSAQALEAEPDAVIWSETAFVPSVDFHTRYHENPSSLRLVRRLEAFLAAKKVPFLVGNDHREKTASGEVVDYNAVLAWDQGWTGRYEKQRLVPFTESFPFRDWLPFVYDWLRAADTHFWQVGRSTAPLTVAGVAVGTPICFEDTFPDTARSLALQGARALANLTNDSWAPGTASRYQHLSLAVFRAVETRLPLVRAGNDGATVAINTRGEMVAALPVGNPGVLQAEVRLGGEALTVYTRFGDILPIVGLVVLFVALVATPRARSVVDKGPEL